MLYPERVASIITGTAITSAILVIQPTAAQALSGEQVNDIAREVTVLIRSERGHGSGVIISRNGDTYYVLTAHHVVDAADEYALVTHDKQAYAIDANTIKPLAGVDLAVLEFSSDRDYTPAVLADSSIVSEGTSVFVSGWPRLTTVGNAAGGKLTRQFTSGNISGFLPDPLEGYEMIYTNTTLGGMSGGPVLDAGGRVVGIHGLGDTENPAMLQREGISQEAASSIAGLIKPGFNYAIPINTFLSGTAQARLFLSLKVESDPAPPLGAPYIASAQPDPRDTVDPDKVFDNINDGVDTMRNIRNLFGF